MFCLMSRTTQSGIALSINYVTCDFANSARAPCARMLRVDLSALAGRRVNAVKYELSRLKILVEIHLGQMALRWSVFSLGLILSSDLKTPGYSLYKDTVFVWPWP